MQRKSASLLRTSFIWGMCLSSLHLCWVLLIAAGWAQALLDFIFKLHMLNSPFQAQIFDPLLALGLLAMTFSLGCFYGAVFYLIKNKFSTH
jgi:hypothetical protein